MHDIFMLPPVLRREILLRLSGAALFATLGAACRIAGMDGFLVLSGFLPALLCAICAWAYAAACKNRVVIEGVCVEVRQTIVKRRAKAVLIKTPDSLVMVKLRNIRLNAAPGSIVRVHVRPDASVYEKDGVMTLLETLAAETKNA